MQVYRRTLILAPHTDDAELGAGGTLARLREEGLEMLCVAFSSARESLPAHMPEDALVVEARAAWDVAGMPQEALRILDFPVRKFPQYRQAILEELIAIKREFDPDLVLAPASTDVHQDHHTIHQEALRAFKQTTLLGYELPWNNIHFSADTVIALHARHVDKKVEAIGAYATQAHRPYTQPELIRSWARTRGVVIGAEYAEAFEVSRWVIPLPSERP